MRVTFDFTPDDGHTQQIVINNANDTTYRTLLAAAEGHTDPDAVLSVVCQPEGQEERSWLFRAARISNVRAG